MKNKISKPPTFPNEVVEALETINATQNPEKAIELHAEIIVHFESRFLELRGRHSTPKDRSDMIILATKTVKEYFEIGKAL